MEFRQAWWSNSRSKKGKTVGHLCGHRRCCLLGLVYYHYCGSRGILKSPGAMTNKKLAIYIFISAAIAAVIMLIFSPFQYTFYPPCLFKKWTGLDCPGCGGTRAMYELLHGNFSTAANYNVSLFIFLPPIIIGLLSMISTKFMSAWQWINRPAFYLGVVLTFWVVRNIPVSSLEWLNSAKWSYTGNIWALTWSIFADGIE